jgi:hypothetical protein
VEWLNVKALSSSPSTAKKKNGIQQTICLGWPQTSILLIAASSRVAKIAGVSHQCPPAFKYLLKAFWVPDSYPLFF